MGMLQSVGMKLDRVALLVNRSSRANNIPFLINTLFKKFRGSVGLNFFEGIRGFSSYSVHCTYDYHLGSILEYRLKGF